MRQIAWERDLTLPLAPPEYVVLRKLEYFREGGSARHPMDIRAIRDVTGVDENLLQPRLRSLGLADLWQQILADK